MTPAELASAAASSPTPSAASQPVARLYGEPMLEYPKDLYIPPDALEVFLERFEGPLDLLLHLIEKNKDKAEKKAKKRSEKAERINEMAQMNARSLKDSANRQVSAMSQKERDEKIENARKNAEHAKPGSLASKANMVKHFNENN